MFDDFIHYFYAELMCSMIVPRHQARYRKGVFSLGTVSIISRKKKKSRACRICIAGSPVLLWCMCRDWGGGGGGGGEVKAREQRKPLGFGQTFYYAAEI